MQKIDTKTNPVLLAAFEKLKACDSQHQEILLLINSLAQKRHAASVELFSQLPADVEPKSVTVDHEGILSFVTKSAIEVPSNKIEIVK